MPKETKSAPQFNFNSLVGIVCTGVVLWVGNSVQKLNEKMVRVEEKLETREKQAAEVDKRITIVEAVIGVRPKP